MTIRPALHRALTMIAAAIMLTLLAPAPSLADEARGARKARRPDVKSITHVSKEDSTRIFINVSGKPEFKAAPGPGGSLIRIEVKNASISRDVARALEVNDGRVKTIRAEPDSQRVRITVSLDEGMEHKISIEERETFILTIDVSPSARKGLTAAEIVEAEPKRDYFNLGGYLKNETAYRLAGPEQLSKVRNIFYLASTGEITGDISYKASGRLVYDAVFDLTDNYPRSVEDGQEFEATMRENYIDISKGEWDFRLGKQQIVWGEAVGLFFADVVNARDLREFVLPDFEYIRIPEWAVDIERATGDFHLELVWVVFPEFNKLGGSGSEFPQPVPVPSGVAAASRGTSEPSAGVGNGEFGARGSYLVEGWDFSVFHLYAWDKFPANFREVTTPALYTFSPAHRRLNVTGLTFAKEAGGAVVKGEFVYNRGKHFSVLDESDADGVVKKDYLDYLLGVDYTFYDKIDFNFQFMQRVIFGYDGGIFREDRVRSSASVWLKTGFFGNAVEPELLVISGLRELDMMIRPKLNFKFKRRWQARVGLDIFEGVHDGIFGQYDDRDRVYAELRYDL